MNMLRAIFLRREAGIAVMIVLFCLAVGAVQAAVPDARPAPHHPAAHPADHDRRHGPDDGASSPGTSISRSARCSAFRPWSAACSIDSTRPGSVEFRGGAGITALGRASAPLLGLVNGALDQLFRLPAIIVTLGTLSLYRGLTFIISNAKQIDRQWIPSELKALSQTSPIFGIPWIIFIAFGVAAPDLLFAMHTRVGRQIFALGSNPVAAPLRGIKVNAGDAAGLHHFRRARRASPASCMRAAGAS